MRQTQWYYLWDLEVSISGLESSSKLESLTDSEELGRGNQGMKHFQLWFEVFDRTLDMHKASSLELYRPLTVQFAGLLSALRGCSKVLTLERRSWHKIFKLVLGPKVIDYRATLDLTCVLGCCFGRIVSRNGPRLNVFLEQCIIDPKSYSSPNEFISSRGIF